MPSFRESKAEAYTYYKNWQKQPTFCKALNATVNITREGWNHLISGSNSRKRSIKDKVRRFKLLKLARYVITNAKNHNRTARGQVSYYELKMQPPGSRFEVKVIIKKDKGGNYIFHSVM